MTEGQRFWAINYAAGISGGVFALLLIVTLPITSVPMAMVMGSLFTAGGVLLAGTLQL